MTGDRKGRLEGELAKAAREYKAAGAALEAARWKVFELACQLNADGVSWRELATLTGVPHPTLLRGAQVVAAAAVEELGRRSASSGR